MMSMCPACGSDWCSSCDCVRETIRKSADDFADGKISAGKLAEVLRVSDKHAFKTAAHAFCDMDQLTEEDKRRLKPLLLGAIAEVEVAGEDGMIQPDSGQQLVEAMGWARGLLKRIGGEG
jgi:hypothetical protein